MNFRIKLWVSEIALSRVVVTGIPAEHEWLMIMKNNAQRYLMIEFSQLEQAQTMPDEDVMAISNRLMEQNREAYEVLAK